MSRQKETKIDVDSYLNDPQTEKIRRELSRTVREAHAEIEEKGEDFSFREMQEEEKFIPDPSMMHRAETRARGPLSNRAQEEFKRRAMEAPIPPPPRWRKTEEKAEVQRPMRQSFNPDIGENEEQPEQTEYITNKPRTNGPMSGPIPAPDISQVQHLEKRIKDLEEAKKTNNLEDGNKAPGRLAARRKTYNSEYKTITPASQCNFYSRFAPNGLEIKKIDVPTQHLITEAKQTQDISGFIDAVGSTLRDVDIRDLTPDDWFYVLYWHKYNSYNRTPLILTWESKYGNENEYIIQESDLKYIYPKLSQEEYDREYYSKGLVVPTLREWELLNTSTDLSPEDKSILMRAQYFKGDTLEEKVDNYFDQGETLETLEIIEELKRKSHHGIVHTVDVIDAKFDPVEYIKNRKDYKASLDSDANLYRDTPAIYTAFKQEAEEVAAEIITLEETLKNGGQVRAEVETQPVRFNALDMFPFL